MRRGGSTPTSPTIQAAHIALALLLGVTVVGIDVTMTTLFSEVAREGDDAAKTLMRMAEFYINAYKTIYPGMAGCGLHDPLAVAIAEDPTLAKTERMFVDVELHGELTRGQTVADRRRTAVPLHNADVCMEVNRAPIGPPAPLLRAHLPLTGRS